MNVRTEKLIIYIVVSTWNNSIAHSHTTTKTVPYGKYSRGTVLGQIIERIDRMSMISEQVHYLRSLAADQTPEALYEVFGALNEAADTIESLSAKLADMERPAEDCGKELLTII